MQAVDVGRERGAVRGLGGSPVPQRGLRRLAVRQPVRDGEAGVPLQLRQDHQHLPAVGGKEAVRLAGTTNPTGPQRAFVARTLPLGTVVPEGLLLIDQSKKTHALRPSRSRVSNPCPKP